MASKRVEKESAGRKQVKATSLSARMQHSAVVLCDTARVEECSLAAELLLTTTAARQRAALGGARHILLGIKITALLLELTVNRALFRLQLGAQRREELLDIRLARLGGL